MIVKITPMGKPRMTQRNKWYKPPAVERYWAYVNELRLVLPGYVLPGELTIEFGVPMPKSWSKKKRAEMVGQPLIGKPDIDNLCKGFMDAFKSDDSHVYKLTAQKFWTEDGYILL